MRLPGNLLYNHKKTRRKQTKCFFKHVFRYESDTGKHTINSTFLSKNFLNRMVETEKNLGLEKENEKTGNVSKVKNLEMALITDAKSDNFEENNFINYSLACSPEIIIQEVS